MAIKPSPKYHLIEYKADIQMRDASKRSQINNVEELIFRHELSVLFQDSYNAARVGGTQVTGESFISQNRDYIKNRIRTRLEGYGLYFSKEEIGKILGKVTSAFLAQLAQGLEPSALPYVEIPTKKLSRPQKKNRKPKQGRKHPVAINGEIWPSQADAIRAGHSRGYVQHQAKKAYNDSASIKLNENQV